MLNEKPLYPYRQTQKKITENRLKLYHNHNGKQETVQKLFL